MNTWIYKILVLIGSWARREDILKNNDCKLRSSYRQRQKIIEVRKERTKRNSASRLKRVPWVDYQWSLNRGSSPRGAPLNAWMYTARVDEADRRQCPCIWVACRGMGRWRPTDVSCYARSKDNASFLQRVRVTTAKGAMCMKECMKFKMQKLGQVTQISRNWHISDFLREDSLVPATIQKLWLTIRDFAVWRTS